MGSGMNNENASLFSAPTHSVLALKHLHETEMIKATAVILSYRKMNTKMVMTKTFQNESQKD